MRQPLWWEAKKPNKDFPSTSCRKPLSPVTLRYFQPHLHTRITIVSTVLSLTTKDCSDKAQWALNLKIALFVTAKANRVFPSQQSYLCPQWLPLDHAPLLAASLGHIIMKVRLLSGPTASKPLKSESSNLNFSSHILATSRISSVLVLPLGKDQGRKMLSHSSFWRVGKPPPKINHSWRQDIFNTQFKPGLQEFWRNLHKAAFVCIYK